MKLFIRKTIKKHTLFTKTNSKQRGQHKYFKGLFDPMLFDNEDT